MDTQKENSFTDFKPYGYNNPEFELRGVNHVALVCKDMQRTVDFYCNMLGMKLVKTIELPFGSGQHFFFDIGNGNCLAFFWFPDAPEPSPNLLAKSLPGKGDFITAIGSMNHLAFDVPPEKIEEYKQRLIEKGIEVSEILNHDDSELTVSETNHPGVFIRSIYFKDPDGILLEFACWTRELKESDVNIVTTSTNKA
jgi:catechol 2,3-dioxygenase-like lactoylglutathione lyase family enzyme